MWKSLRTTALSCWNWFIHICFPSIHACNYSFVNSIPTQHPLIIESLSKSTVFVSWMSCVIQALKINHNEQQSIWSINSICKLFFCKNKLRAASHWKVASHDECRVLKAERGAKGQQCFLVFARPFSHVGEYASACAVCVCVHRKHMHVCTLVCDGPRVKCLSANYKDNRSHVEWRLFCCTVMDVCMCVLAYSTWRLSFLIRCLCTWNILSVSMILCWQKMTTERETSAKRIQGQAFCL